MPFISKDWRAPGDLWLKTDDGWEKMKVLECEKKARSTSDDEASSSDEAPQPHCQIILRRSREIAGFNGLGEVVKRLDFRSSVRDHRRFQYICALLKLLVSSDDSAGIANLSGNAQRILLQMIEEVAKHVSVSQQHFNVLRGLVDQLRHLVEQENKKCWGKPGENLWLTHLQAIERIQNIASQIQIQEPVNSRPQFDELPEECIRKILLQLSDHKDLESSADAWSLMSFIIQEQRIWKELSHFHFTEGQIDHILEKMSLKETKERHRNWQTIYHALRKKFGLREDLQYTEVLALCRFCRCLFWPSMGHPCIVDQSPEFRERLERAGTTNLEHHELVPPQQFLKYFSL